MVQSCTYQTELCSLVSQPFWSMYEAKNSTTSLQIHVYIASQNPIVQSVGLLIHVDVMCTDLYMYILSGYGQAWC